MLEIIALTPEEARIAESAGAGRIELVSALAEGGLTPGFDLMQRTVAAVRIPVNAMIRPHSRGFHYSLADLDVMKAAIRAARTAGANGVVLGVLDGDGAVHATHLEELLACVGELEVTFHRAIDEARDPVAAAEALSHYPAIRSILTSGGHGRIEDNTITLARMREVAGPIRLMAGGGLTLENTARIIRGTAFLDYHYGTAVRTGGTVAGELEPERLGELIRILEASGRRAVD